jgi:hypothetical protein
MPRRAGLDAPGTLHHVIVRGIEQRQLGFNWQKTLLSNAAFR